MAGQIIMTGANYALYGIPVVIPETITLSVGAGLPNVALPLSGTIANGTPTALDFSTDGGNTWLSVGNFVLAGNGNWTGSGPTYGVTTAGTLIVRDHAQIVRQSAPAAFSVSSVPFAGNCLGYFYTNSGLLAPNSSTLLTDLSPQHLAASLTGGPTMHAGYMSCGAPALGQGMASQVLDPQTDLTIACIVRSSDVFTSNGTTPWFVTNKGTDNNANGITGAKAFSLTMASATQLTGQDTNATAGAANVFNINQPETAGFAASWMMLAMSVSTVGGVTTRTLTDLTHALVKTDTTHGARVANGLLPFQAGGTLSNGYGGITDTAFVGIYNTDLSLVSGGSTGLAQLKARIVADFAALGIASTVTGF